MVDRRIAIVGMSFRLPGDLSSEEAFWQALRDGRDMVGRISEDRWATDTLAHPRRSEPGRSVTFAAGVLSTLEAFDAAFFGISPREAAHLDPQQRLLLEMSWEAMENGGLRPDRLAGSDCAVFVGISGLDYGMRGLDDLSGVDAYSMTGNTLSLAANRLSYVFDLRGPSMAVDTACSSSLVALHQACRCLCHGDASMALVGGINLLLHPYPFIGFTKASMLSAGGRCRTFAASGDGYARAEGGAILLLKPLAQAEADGDDIRAVILATGSNSDGARKSGITIPSIEGQSDLLRRVLSEAGLTPAEVDYVEAHGTGTAVGDPVEANAIGSVLGRDREAPLWVGSVKSNLGHLEPASGMAGLVKTVLALGHGAVPPSIHFTTPNPDIDFAGLNLDVVTSYCELPELGRPRRMGVNSFGFGGTNAHVILEEYCQTATPLLRPGPVAVPALFLSARSASALRELARRYAAQIAGQDELDYYDLAYGAAHHRQWLEQRVAIHGADPAEVTQRLAAWSRGEPVRGWWRWRPWPHRVRRPSCILATAPSGWVWAGGCSASPRLSPRS
jgi:acyl transferase domain-containing protein